MSLEHLIICDGCGAAIDGHRKSFAAARRNVREMGGRVSLPGGKDLCPDCVKTGREPE